MRHFVGIDLHWNNTCTLISDDQDRCVLKKKFPNQLAVILEFLEPYKDTIVGIVVESTPNWYWLVDGLMEAGYSVHLAHPAGIESYSGKKHTNDFDDAAHLAYLLRIGKLPKGYIYPKAERPLRDLLRKRMLLKRNRTQHILSFKSLVNRHLGEEIGTNEIQRLQVEDLEAKFKQEHVILSAQANIATIGYLSNWLLRLETSILEVASLKPEFEVLLTAPGIGKIIGLTIALETGEINRFARVGNYASYCRCVESKCVSNNRKKGENNRKNGNKYLAWAFVEAAQFARRYCPYAKAFYERKKKQSGKVVLATKALANKLSRACYHMLKKQQPYDVNKIFGRRKVTIQVKSGSEPKQGTDQNHPPDWTTAASTKTSR